MRWRTTTKAWRRFTLARVCYANEVTVVKCGVARSESAQQLEAERQSR